MSNYAEIIKQNLDRLYNPITANLAKRLPAQHAGDNFVFQAFGES